MISSTLTHGEIEKQFYSIMTKLSASIQRQSRSCTEKLCFIDHKFSGRYEFVLKNKSENEMVGDLVLDFDIFYAIKSQFFDVNDVYDYTVTIPNFIFNNHSVASFSNAKFSFQELSDRHNLERRLGVHGVLVKDFFAQIEKDYNEDLYIQMENSFNNARMSTPEFKAMLNFLQ